MHITPILLCLLPCLVWGDDTTAERNKRSLGMLRMGKRSLQMLRMGRSVPDNEYPNYDNSRDDQERTPPMPRLGKNLQSILNDDYRRYMDEEAVYDIAQQLLRNSAEHNSRFARSTQTVQDPIDPVMDRERRLPRLGLRDELPRLGLRDDEAALEDAELPRMGLRSSERSLPFPRLGYREAEEKRAMSMLRMGKRGMSMLRMGKRPVSMLRMGRSDGEEQEKRAMSMLRMGKRAMSMLRMGKRPMSMLRMGKKDDYVVPNEEKRAMSMLRMGKRYNNEEYKRAMSMLRMGKRAEGEEEKRALGMLRMGKRGLDTDNSQAAEKKEA